MSIIRSQIQKHPEDMSGIQREAREAEDERQRKMPETRAMGIAP
jgi:hypothetical protein